MKKKKNGSWEGPNFRLVLWSVQCVSVTGTIPRYWSTIQALHSILRSAKEHLTALWWPGEPSTLSCCDSLSAPFQLGPPSAGLRLRPGCVWHWSHAAAPVRWWRGRSFPLPGAATTLRRLQIPRHPPPRRPATSLWGLHQPRQPALRRSR